LDGLRAQKACLWGVDLTGSDIGFADLKDTDLRCSILKDACLAESDLSFGNLQGAYFSGTIIESTRLDGALLSCPSFWDCDLQSAASIKEVIYNHRGETRITISSLPIVLKAFSKRMILLNGFCLWGQDLFKAGDLPLEAQQVLFQAKVSLEKMMSGDLQSATIPIPKIHNEACKY
jgi:uncharacterized protein YjbI with pentapeptide repeats